MPKKRYSKNKPKTQKKVESYFETKLRETYSDGKNFAYKHGMSGLIALLISSVVPMLEQWHSDNMYKQEINQQSSDLSQQIKDSESRTTKLIDDCKNDENDKIKSLWDYLSKDINKK